MEKEICLFLILKMRILFESFRFFNIGLLAYKRSRKDIDEL
jgi:hypothetical protein